LNSEGFEVKQNHPKGSEGTVAAGTADEGPAAEGTAEGTFAGGIAMAGVAVGATAVPGTPVAPASIKADVPKDGLPGLIQNWKTDIVSGLIVFLVALPLCLGIALASGVPPLAGIFSAVVGGLVISLISGSYVTINGPAAGLIVVVLASVERLGGGTVGYHATLAAIVVSGIILFIMGLLKAGELGEFFPSIVMHGLLAAIGIIIVAKQLPFVLGVTPEYKEPLALLLHIPQMIQHLNPEIAAIGLVSLTIMFVHGTIGNKLLRRIPAPIIVVVVSIIMGGYLDLSDVHRDMIAGHSVELSPKFLVSLPANVAEGIAFPNFAAAFSYPFLISVVSITLVQFIESLLSAAAVDKIDPFHRTSNLSRDVAAIGLGSAIAGAIGGLPIIAEIVRSTANISNGARTRWSNFFHGCFMLASVVFCTAFINRIPLAALAALLVFTGLRLASPKIFREVREIGLEQVLVFVITIFATLTTDLLIGVAVGIAVKLAMHLVRGVPVRSLIKANVTVMDGADNCVTVKVNDSAIFTNYLSLKGQLTKAGKGKSLLVDLSDAKLIDHTVMERLHHYLQEHAKTEGGSCKVKGLESHKPSSKHLFAARRMVRRS
jgi:MFS superfamily sulfate permease-like transporter